MNSIFVRFYEGIIRAGECISSYFLLAIRLFWGYQFFITGYGKLQNIPKVAGYFQSLGIPFAEANAYTVGSIEMVGGLLLIVGLASRLISIPLICVLLTAYATAHQAALLNIFNDPDTFLSQPPFHFLMMLLVVFCFGPGKFSLDYLLERWIKK